MYSDARTGFVLVLGHLATVGAALLLLFTHVALGARIRRALGVPGRREATWRWPVAWASWRADSGRDWTTWTAGWAGSWIG